MVRAGIYKITNLVNGKVYIGQSVNLERRLAEYENSFKSGRSKCCNDYILQSFRKHGRQNFSVEILVEFPFFDFKNTEDCQFLNFAERYFIRKYKSTDKFLGYNFSEGTTYNYPTKKLKHQYKLQNVVTKEIIETNSLARFCVENSLDQRRMFSISKNRPECRTHKNWTVLEVDGEILDQSNRNYSKERAEKISQALKGRKNSETSVLKGVMARVEKSAKYLITSNLHPPFCSLGLRSPYLLSLGLDASALLRVARGETVLGKHKGYTAIEISS